MKIVDLSHPVEDGMITYQGLPGPVLSDHLSREASRKNYSAGVEFHIGKIEMVANTGTYIDSPFHRYVDGVDIGRLPLESIANIPGIVLRSTELAIGPEIFRKIDLREKAVLVNTGWARHWRTDRYSEGHPYLSRQAAEYLLGSGVRLVGVDTYNIDDHEDRSRPVHSLLLDANIPIVEHLCNLEALPENGFLFFAVPAPVIGIGSFPVRAFGIVQ